MSEPEFFFGSGRNQIKLKGDEAIREGAPAIRFLLRAKGVALVLWVLFAGASSAGVVALLRWLLG
ncbi:MAG TPA: hypothetical protein VGG11_13760 [Xanthobacteraceae bacterium]